MRDAVDRDAARDDADVEGELTRVIGEGGHAIHDAPELGDGVGTPRMLGPGMGAAAFDRDPERGPAFAGDDERRAALGTALRLEDQGRERAPRVEALAADLREMF